MSLCVVIASVVYSGQVAPVQLQAALIGAKDALMGTAALERLVRFDATQDKMERIHAQAPIIREIQWDAFQKHGTPEEIKQSLTAHGRIPEIETAVNDLNLLITRILKEGTGYGIRNGAGHRKLAYEASDYGDFLTSSKQERLEQLQVFRAKGAPWAQHEVKRIAKTIQTEDRRALSAVSSSLHLASSREKLLEVFARAASGENSNTKFPTKFPTETPTKAPTSSPTKAPTEIPTSAPTPGPTKSPSVSCGISILNMDNMKTWGDLPDGNEGEGLGEASADWPSSSSTACKFDDSEGDSVHTQNTLALPELVQHTITFGSTGDTNLALHNATTLADSKGTSYYKRPTKAPQPSGAARFHQRAEFTGGVDNRFVESDPALVPRSAVHDDLTGYCAWTQKISTVAAVPAGTSKVYMRLYAKETGELKASMYPGMSAAFYVDIREEYDRVRGFLRFCTNATAARVCGQWEELVHHKDDYTGTDSAFGWLGFYQIDGNKDSTRQAGSIVKQQLVPADRRFLQTRVLTRSSKSNEKEWIQRVEVYDGTACGDL